MSCVCVAEICEEKCECLLHGGRETKGILLLSCGNLLDTSGFVLFSIGSSSSPLPLLWVAGGSPSFSTISISISISISSSISSSSSSSMARLPTATTSHSSSCLALQYPSSSPHPAASSILPHDMFHPHLHHLHDLVPFSHDDLHFFNCRLNEQCEWSLAPLIQKNEELNAEQQALLLRNSELYSQKLLLNLENQRLKQQLEMELQKRSQQRMVTEEVSSDPFLVLEYFSSDSDEEDEDDEEGEVDQESSSFFSEFSSE